MGTDEQGEEGPTEYAQQGPDNYKYKWVLAAILGP